MSLSLPQEIGQQLVTGFREHAFRMELHALKVRVLPMPQPHDGSVLEPGRHLKAFGETGPLRDQGVVAGGGEGLRQSGEDAFSPVQNGGRLAVHLFDGTDHAPAVHLGDGLVTKADPEGRRRRGQLPENLKADAGLVRIPRAWREQDRVGSELSDRRKIEFIISVHPQVGCDRVLRSEFPEVLDQVESETVVVVDDQQHRLNGWGSEPQTEQQGGEQQEKGDQQ